MHAMIIKTDFRNLSLNQMRVMIESNSTVFNTKFNTKEELDLYLWLPIETKCEQYLIFWIPFSENAKLLITWVPL